MPIRLNLLADAQAAEVARRRDPVKRELVAAVVLVCLLLIWSSSLQPRILLAKADLNRTQAAIDARTNEYRQVLDDQKKLVEMKEKLAALQRLSANRFLQATLLNALQHTLVDDVRLFHLGLEQNHSAAQAPRPRPLADHCGPATVPGATEHMLLTLDATDSSADPGDQVNKFRNALAGNPYFQERLDKTNSIILVNYSAPQMSRVTDKTSVLFRLQCQLQEKKR